MTARRVVTGMTKKNKRNRKHKSARPPAARRRRVRIKPHKGPFQLELPLQMPLFPVQTVIVSPVSLPSSSSLPPPLSLPAEAPAAQPLLLDFGAAS